MLWRSAQKTYILQLFKKDTSIQVFSCECCDIFWTNFFVEHFRAISSENKKKRYKLSRTLWSIPLGIYFKVNNRNTKTMCKICSKLTIKTPERCQWRRSGLFIVNFEQISHLFLLFPLLTLNK